MQPEKTSAQILLFPLERVRPGVRQRLHSLRRCITEARQDQSWSPDQSSVTPELVLNMIPSLEGLYKSHDKAVSKIADQVTLLCMHAIQGGQWQRKDMLGELMDLQHSALELSSKASTKRQA